MVKNMSKEEMMKKGYLTSQANADILENIINRHAAKIQKDRETKKQERVV